jgi:4-hydroxy-tetrahydrodipicolinate synthase
VRNVFEKYNLISGLHSYYSKQDEIYENLLPPLKILNEKEEKDLFESLEKLNFFTKLETAA